MRKLATIREVGDIKPIEGADKIELATFGGWQVVVEKGLYKSGDEVIYCEIDSWIPNGIAPFLSKGKAPREFEGVKGERLKSIKLRGALSQGLVLPKAVLGGTASFKVGDNVTDELGIIKWELPVHPQLAGRVSGNFPHFIPKTDQERVQNINLSTIADNSPYEITEKLDGSSCTIYYNDGKLGVCSRNLELKIDDDNAENAFVKQALLLKDALEARQLNVALQGELVGPKIQGNPYKLEDHKLYIFDVWDIDKQGYFTSDERRQLLQELGYDLNVPVEYVEHPVYWDTTYSELLHKADGMSELNHETRREGLVYKSLVNPNFSFKTISDVWLLKNKDK